MSDLHHHLCSARVRQIRRGFDCRRDLRVRRCRRPEQVSPVRPLHHRALPRGRQREGQGAPGPRECRWTGRELNLLQDFSHLGRFDVIFCRNVLIYFQVETKKVILDRMATMLPADGYLMMGAAETVIGITETFGRVKEHRAAVYAPDSSGQSLGIRTDSNQLPTPATLLREATSNAPVAK